MRLTAAPPRNSPGRQGGQAGAARPAGRGSPRALTALALLAIAGLAILVRQPWYLLEHSFWLDESWVVDSVRAPLRQAPLMTASTPLGWTLLLRLTPPIGDPERYRLIPMAFGVAAVLPAWWLGGRLAAAGWRRLAASALVALAVAAAPASLSRMDLKQYTTDAFAAISILALAALVEERWGWRRLALLAAGSVVFIPLSHAAFIAAAAGLAALAAGALLGRRWRRLAMLAAAALPVVAVAGAWYLLTVAPGDNAYLHVDWEKAGHFVPLDRGPVTAVRFLGTKLAGALGRAGFGAWPVALVLAAAGVAGFWRRGNRAAALYLPLLLAGMATAAALELYPLFEERTSVFVSVLLTLYAAAGVATIALRLLPRPDQGPEADPDAATVADRGKRSGLRPLAAGRALAAVVVVAVAAALLTPAAAAGASRRMPESGVLRQIDYVRAHMRPGDAILIEQLAQFGFAYYWPDQPTFEPATAKTAVRFQVSYPDRPELLVVHQADWESITRDVARAARSGAPRVWIIIAHGGPTSWRRWRDIAAAHGPVTLTPTPRGRTMPYLLEPRPAPAPG